MCAKKKGRYVLLPLQFVAFVEMPPTPRRNVDKGRRGEAVGGAVLVTRGCYPSWS